MSEVATKVREDAARSPKEAGGEVVSLDDVSSQRTILAHMRQWAEDPEENRDHILRACSRMRLISGASSDARLPIKSDDQSKIAVFEEGLVLISQGVRWDPSVTDVINRANALFDHWFSSGSIVPLPRDTIELLYQQTVAEAPSQQREEGLTRQRTAAALLREGAESEATDLQIMMQPRYALIRQRVHGRMQEVRTLDNTEAKAIINAIFAIAFDQGSHAGEQEFRQGTITPASGILPKSIDQVRLQYSPTSSGRGNLAMRLKYREVLETGDVDRLGYLSYQVADIKTMRRRTSGAYMIAGKVSSGKTTTLQKILNNMFIEKDREITLYTIEEPVELEIEGASQIAVTATNSDERTRAFARAMNAALRSDPNVILVGELRDKPTADLAIRAALSGHALWTSIHAGSALGILARLIDLGVDMWKITDPSIVRGLMAQRLVGVLCPHCRIDYNQAVKSGRLSRDLATRTIKLLQRRANTLFMRGDGCPHCKGGLKGRTVVAETILPDEKLLTLFASGDMAEVRHYWLRAKDEGGLGGVPMLHAALLHVARGTGDINEIEEEVDLLSVYEQRYTSLVPRLRAESDRLLKGEPV